jgi:hypothetical protein
MINMSYNAEIPDIIHQMCLRLNQVQIYKNSARLIADFGMGIAD